MSAAITRLQTQERTRVEDFLNDKLQTSADLSNLDSLLQNVRHQQSLLEEQVGPICPFH